MQRNNGIVVGYEPKSLYYYFEEISKIPRSSGNEKEISDFLANFAKKYNLEYYQDDIYNIIIKKAGSTGCKNENAVILQGHTDMVCEKNVDTIHDFDKDPLKLRVIDGKLMATGTTLGADNGVAVAMMLAILSDSELVHPPLECVFTVQEETGLCGAANIDSSKLKGKTMINLDSEDEGIATVSCAGGMRVRLSREILWEKKEGFVLKITIKGLCGGHSGMDISKELANSNKLLSRILYAINDRTDMQLCSIFGGSKDNAIPREAEAVILFNSSDERNIAMKIADREALDIANEYETVEPRVKVESFTDEMGLMDSVLVSAMDKSTSNAVINCIYLAPNGVLNRNVKAGGFTVRSINLGVVKIENNKVILTFAPRSSVASLQAQTKKELELLSRIFGFEYKIDSEYPGWSYSEKSPIREVFMDCYREQYNNELQIEAIHAGLECGLFCEKLDGLDVIAVGPTVTGCHTPDESLDLMSCQRTYKLLTAVLKRLAG